MRQYVMETETWPARGGERRGLSLDCVIVSKPPNDPITEITMFGVADMIDPNTQRIEDTAFTLRTYTGATESDIFQGVASWKFDPQQFYSEITAKFGDTVVLGTTSEEVTGGKKKLQFTLVLP